MEFDIQKFENCAVSELLAIYYYMGHQMEALNEEKERLASARIAILTRVHELQDIEIVDQS